MRIKIAGGIEENGIAVGNTYDKYGSKNPLVRYIMRGFASALTTLVQRANPGSIHEIGCGEGYWVLHWNKQGLSAIGTDFSAQVIEIARKNAVQSQIAPTLFNTLSIYDLNATKHSADLIICCEVLEHLENPKAALEALQRVVTKNLIISVPREPLWCALNLARAKYLSDWGNTPGHIQHWSQHGFISLVSNYFEIVEIKSPLPWTMLLCKPI